MKPTQILFALIAGVLIGRFLPCSSDSECPPERDCSEEWAVEVKKNEREVDSLLLLLEHKPRKQQIDENIKILYSDTITFVELRKLWSSGNFKKRF